jgi:hypothetical protein
MWRNGGAKIAPLLGLVKIKIYILLLGLVKIYILL